MKKISVLLVCFLMLFAFASCDNGGSSPAEAVETTATEKQIATVNTVVNTLIKVEVVSNIQGEDIDINKDNISVPSDAGVITGSLTAKGHSEFNGSVDVVADLKCGDSSITLDGSLSWTVSDDMDINVDTSKLVATINGATINGKDITVEISIWDIT